MPSRKVMASSDDCYAQPARLGGNDTFSLTTHGFGAGFNVTFYVFSSGARFINVNIPQGAHIDIAYLSFRSRLVYTGTVVRTNIIGEDIDDAATFSTLSDYEGRPRTIAIVTWDNIDSWTLDIIYTSPSIVPIIQEIVNRPGWVSGNSLVLFWEDDGSDWEAWRSAYSYDKDPEWAPMLTFQYSLTAGSASVQGIGTLSAIGSSESYSPRETKRVEDKVTLELIRNIEMESAGQAYIDKEGNFTYKSRYGRIPT